MGNLGWGCPEFKAPVTRYFFWRLFPYQSYFVIIEVSFGIQHPVRCAGSTIWRSVGERIYGSPFQFLRVDRAASCGSSCSWRKVPEFAKRLRQTVSLNRVDIESVRQNKLAVFCRHFSTVYPCRT